jgi:DeoR family transcriptional regulator, aga operon transcriptional repressor
VDRHERLNTLLELVAERGSVDVERTARELDVSAATVRRDLDHLAHQQLVTRTRGGAVANGVSYDLPLRYKTARQASEKQRIGAAAAGMVAAGSVVGLSGGTTTTEVARAIAARADLDANRDGHRDGQLPAVTVVTNALNIANELVVRPHVKIVVTGGVARPQSYECIGPLATHVLAELSLDIVFLGVNAIDPRRGVSAHHEGEADINRLMARRADQIVVVADSTKLGQQAFARVCDIGDVDVIITDRAAPDETVHALEDAGVRVLCV